jgi:hypothetical protein
MTAFMIIIIRKNVKLVIGSGYADFGHSPSLV